MPRPAANAAPDAPAPRSIASRVWFAVLGLSLFIAFTGLGIWQVERRAWKHALIEQVDQRLHAAPVAAPGRSDWPRIGAADAYRRMQLSGTFLHDHEVQVQAVTERGPGFWVLTPLRSAGGFIVMVNRGFVEADRREPSTRVQGRPSGPVHIVGLLRLSEPGGGFLRHNDPAMGRWYSRDVAAIVAAQDLPTTDVAPYFIDADAASSPGTDGQPAGGLTVVSFHDSHLVYAITWFTLALLVLGASLTIGRREWSPRR